MQRVYMYVIRTEKNPIIDIYDNVIVYIKDILETKYDCPAELQVRHHTQVYYFIFAFCWAVSREKPRIHKIYKTIFV